MSEQPYEERDFEKQKDECTFKPKRFSKDIKKVEKILKPVVELNRDISPRKDQVKGYFKDFK